MKITLIEPLGVKHDTITRLSQGLTAAGHEFVYYSELSENLSEQIARIEEADVVMLANHEISNEAIRAAKNLKMLSVAFTGVDHVGLEACRERNIVVTNAAGFSNDSVAELVIGLTIAVMRNIVAGDIATRHARTRSGLIGNELRGKTVGIVGTGRIGREAAKLFQAFNCKVLGYNPSKNSAGEKIGIEYVGLEELLKTSDVVSLHFPLNERTRGFIDADKLALMKSSAILINCARGAVVDNAALARRLNDGKIAGAGIDVFDMEPPIPADYPLLSAKNTVLTPHVAFATAESMEKRAKITFDNVSAWLDGNAVNVVV